MVNETEGAILLSIHQNTFSDSKYSGAQVFYGPEGESMALANEIQAEFRRTVNPDSQRQIKKADGVYLMQHIHTTGVLVECGFLSNPTEEAKLRDPDHQKKLCCVIAAETAAFLKEKQTLDRGEQA
jgi:N-acetylmuramoyl-L-alanine amidase